MNMGHENFPACTPVHSWGRLQAAQHRVCFLNEWEEIPRILQTTGPGIAHGLGRSYGDMALNPGGTLWNTTGLDQFLHFDPDRGLLHCQSGVSLRDIQRTMLPQGWSLPVIPGTQFVTVGGAIANDVHGKNHHRHGSFGNQVHALTLVRSTGETLACSQTENQEHFRATIGGMGLTGLILDAHLQLQRIPGGDWLNTQTIPFHGLEDFFSLTRDSEADWEYTVAWLDCMARKPRGIFLRANHAQNAVPAPRLAYPGHPKKIGLTPPFPVFNRLGLRALNAAYFYGKSIQAKKIKKTGMESFFFPLDMLADWNRLYGPKGFYQYQCVIPEQGGKDAISEILAQISASGQGSFLAVLKTFGHIAPVGMLSFPLPRGITLALDFPNRQASTHHLFERLDGVVAAAGGRLYPAKDARMPASLFLRGYPRLEEFLPLRDPAMSSALSRRLLGH